MQCNGVRCGAAGSPREANPTRGEPYQQADHILCHHLMARYFRDDPSARLLTGLLFLHPALLCIDHVHFQYNGFLLGVLVFSMAMLKEGRGLASGILFAVALNLKHINLYVAPVFFVHLLREHCFQLEIREDKKTKTATVSYGGWSWRKFLVLGISVIFVFLASFGPWLKQLPQVLRRRKAHSFSRLLLIRVVPVRGRSFPDSFPSSVGSATRTGLPTSGHCTT